MDRKQVLEQLDLNPCASRNSSFFAVPPARPKHIFCMQPNARGRRSADLERSAHHRGSLRPEPGIEQPSQRHFESGLAAVLTRLDPAQPVFIEAESNKIGAIHIPKVLWHAMKNAPFVSLSPVRSKRVGFLL